MQVIHKQHVKETHIYQFHVNVKPAQENANHTIGFLWWSSPHALWPTPLQSLPSSYKGQGSICQPRSKHTCSYWLKLCQLYFPHNSLELGKRNKKRCKVTHWFFFLCFSASLLWIILTSYLSLLVDAMGFSALLKLTSTVAGITVLALAFYFIFSCMLALLKRKEKKPELDHRVWGG